jgi:hypothetical protein
MRRLLLENLTPTTVVARGEYHMLYNGRKQEIYKKAGESLVLRPVHPGDAICSTFVKAEKVNFSAKPDPAPRVIQPRSPRYNLEVGRYLKLFEKEILRGFRRAFGYNVVVKGLNASEVATCLRSNWDQFETPVAIGLDASRFDQHVSADMLRFEHSIYNEVFKCPNLARLLEWQIDNRGIARVGEHRVDYRVHGCRMSGDINTGMGNCMLMSLMVLSYLDQHMAGRPHRLANNGDDCVIFIEARDLDRLKNIPDWFRELGFTIVTEAPVYEFEHVVFCQTQPVLTSTGWRMVRDPRTAPSKDATSLQAWETEEDVRVWCHAIGSCGLELTRGVPFWEAHYRSLLQYGVKGKRRSGGVEETGMYMLSKGVVGGEVTAESRASFYKAFGMLPAFQIALESRSLQLTVDPKHGMIAPTITTDCNNDLARWSLATRNP